MLVEPKAKEAYAVRVKSPPAQQRETVRNQLNREILDTVDISGKKHRPDRASVAAHARTADKVDLSRTLSIDDVNRLMVTEVGRKVEKMFEAAGINPSSVADTDWSSDATAERIFRGTTGLFEIWKAQHKDMSESELIDSFEQVLRASVDQGASEAIGLIEARQFDDENAIVGTAKETISLVHNKFDTYFESLREGVNAERDDEAGGQSEPE